MKLKYVFAQSFNLDDVLYWIEHEPKFGKQAVYLDDNDNPQEAENTIDMMLLLDVLAQDVSSKGIISAWPAMVAYYAKCRSLKFVHIFKLVHS